MSVDPKADFQKYPQHISLSCCDSPKHNIVAETSAAVRLVFALQIIVSMVVHRQLFL